MVRKLEQYYRYYVPSAQIATEYGVSAEHALVTDHYGRQCSYLGDPFINNCHYDAAGTLLQWTQKSPLKPRVNASRSNVSQIRQSFLTPTNHTHSASPVRVYVINQGQYTPFNLAPRDLSLADKAYVYVPQSCLDAGQC